MAVYNTNGSQLNAVYSTNGISLNAAFNTNGVQIFSSGEQGDVDYSSYSVSEFSSVSCAQGFAIYNGLIFNTTGDGKCKIIDVATNTLLQTVNITTGHGNSASFGEFLNDGDAFPLLYVSKDQGTPCEVYIYHITRAGNSFTFELVRTLRWNVSDVGYYANASLDNENSIVYMYGYSEDNWRTDNGGSNVMILTAWDLSDLTEISAGVYTPQFIKKITTNYFVYAHFGQTFHDGKVWSGTPDVGYADPKAYGINVDTGTIEDIIHLPTNGEAEGICFLNDFNAVVGYINNSFFKLTFSQT